LHQKCAKSYYFFLTGVWLLVRKKLRFGRSGFFQLVLCGWPGTKGASGTDAHKLHKCVDVILMKEVYMEKKCWFLHGGMMEILFFVGM
jgi:hypothetical protein